LEEAVVVVVSAAMMMMMLLLLLVKGSMSCHWAELLPWPRNKARAGVA
jgi:hypothetical protein